MTATWCVLVGDVRERLASLQDSSVHCVVTSPPYFGLRDYGTATWEGGDPTCAHAGRAKPQQDTTGSGVNKGRFAGTRGTQPGKRQFVIPVREVCRCGAKRIDQQIGLETTPDEYVSTIVAVFREVRRVLRPEGLLWLNLGDSYANDGKWGGETGGLQAYLPDDDRRRVGREKRVTGLKPKDLIGIPWRVAFALQADGWYLRQCMPWLKRNGMPESVEDRPTTSVETLFLLAKSEDCYYDVDAVMKVGAIAAGTRAAKGSRGRGRRKDVNGRPPEYWEYTGQRFRRSSDWFFETFEGLLGDEDSQPLAFVVNTKPYTEAHFATFPPGLVEPCILASTSERGCCSVCGAPVVRVVERQAMEVSPAPKRMKMQADDPLHGRTQCGGTMTEPPRRRTVGWEASCECAAPTEPCRVLDPFVGSGTSSAVAVRLGRSAIGIELSTEYAAQARARIGNAAPLLAQEAS